MAEVNKHEPVAIVGMAGIFPGSDSVAGFFRNVLHKRCFVREVPDWLWEHEVFYDDRRATPAKTYSRLGAMLGDMELDMLPFRIPPTVAAGMSRNQKLALVCAHAALADAGCLQNGFDRQRAGVVIAASGGELAEATDEVVQARRFRARLERLAQTPQQRDTLAGLLRAYDLAHPEASITEDTLPGQLSSLVAGRIASAFDLHGMNLTLDAACASSLAAIAIAGDSLRTGACDLVIAGGVDTDMSAKAYVTYAKIGAISATGSFPFDAAGDGFVLGEGCGLLVMKRYSDAVRDRDRIYAVIRGWGSASDGAGKGITAPSAEGQLLSMQRAYADAGVSPADLHFIECHGTGTRVGDATELDSVGRLMRACNRTAALPIGSSKAMVGHLRLAAGTAGLFRAILAVNSRVVPPQVNFRTPNPNVDWAASRVRVAQKPEPVADADVKAGVSGFGFGGINFHIVVASAPACRRDPIVNAADFLLPALPPLVNDTALLFPGQGSQYVGMLAALRHDPVAQSMLAAADKVVMEVSGVSLADRIYPAMGDSGAKPSAADEAALRSTAIAQPAIFTVSAILLRLARERGLTAGLVAGHSLGEYTALHAAGVLSFEDAVRAVAIRGALMSATMAGDTGAMAVVFAGADRVRPLLDSVGGYLTCSNINSYDQTVVSGETAAVNALVKHAAKCGLRATPLNVDRAFHSRLVSPIAAPLRKALEKMTFRSASLPVPANISREVYPYAPAGADAGRPMSVADRDVVIEMLCRQVDSPVDFLSQVELAYEAGIRRFLEVGPRNVLTRLVEDILQGKPFQAIALDDPRHDVTEVLAGLNERLRMPVPIPRRPLPSKPRRVAPSAIAAAPSSVEEPSDAAARVRSVVAAVTGYAPSQISDDAEFERDLGIDTLKIVEIITRLRGTVLPRRFSNLRQATSVRKILAFAETAPRTEEARDLRGNESAVPVLRKYQYQTAVVGTVAGCGPVQWADRGFRVIVAPELAAGGFVADGVTVDDTSPDLLLIRPMLTGPEDLCGQTIPGILRLVTDLAARAPASGPVGHVHLVTLSSPAGFNEAVFRALSAMVKSLQKDVPHLRFAYSHIDMMKPEPATWHLVLASPALGRRIHADGRLEEGRLVAYEAPAKAESVLANLLGAGDVVLVTGGARGIAALMVRRLLDVTAARFILVGRKPQAEEWVAERGRGRVEYLVADLCDERAVQALDLKSRRITLLIHAAGIVISRPLREIKAEDTAAVMGTKVLGLHRVCAGLDPRRLRGIVAFSSIAGYIGGDGHPDYAAANAYLDGFAWEGVPVLSIGWSAWDGVGMATAGDTRRFLELAGVELIPPEQGVEAFSGLLADFLAAGSDRLRNLVVSAGLAPNCCVPGDPFRAALAGPGGVPAEPACAISLPGLGLGDTAVRVMNLSEAARYGEEQLAVLFTPAESAEVAASPSAKRRAEKLAGKVAVKLLARDILLDWYRTQAAVSAVQVLSPATPVVVGAPGDTGADKYLAGLSFSISHTGDFVCAAVSRRRVGVDAERVRPLAAETVREICGSVGQQPDDVVPIIVFTRKEAVLKAAGVGIGGGLKEVAIDGSPVDGPALARYRGAEYDVVTVVNGDHVFSLAGLRASSQPSADGPRQVTASIGQEGLWFEEKTEATGATYVVVVQERLRGSLEVPVLGRALQYVVDRHESLRTVFRDEEGTCRAEVPASVRIDLPFVDLSGMPLEDALDEVGRQGRQNIRQGFDLNRGPLLRAVLFRLGPEDHILVLMFHHMIIDGVSAEMFRRELAECHRAFRAGEQPKLPPLPMQFTDWARRQRERLTPGRISELVGYWRARLDGAPELTALPTDRRRPEIQTFRAGYVVMPVPPEVMRAVRDLGRTEGTTAFVAVTAAFQALLTLMSGQDDIVIGAPFVGRDGPDDFLLVGYFTNILPLRMDSSGNPTFRQLLPRVRAAVLGALEHQDLPFPKLVEALMPRRRAAYPPFFQNVIRLLQDDREGIGLAGSGREFTEVRSGYTGFDFMLTVGIESCMFEIEYNSELFVEATVKRLAGRFLRLLTAVAGNPDLNLADIPLMAADEQERIVRDWNDTSRPLTELGIHTIFARQAALTPDAVALDGYAGQVSYRELNERANRLAHYLQRAGVGPDVPVGVAMERSPDLVVALLGILKAGGAYLPLDTDDPVQRMEFILNETRPRMIVTQDRLRERLPPFDREVLCVDSGKDVLDRESTANPETAAGFNNLAYIMYTSGSTGLPKGVAICHRGIVRLLFGTDYVELGPGRTLLHMSRIAFDASTFELWAALLHGGRCVLLPSRAPDVEELGCVLGQYRVDTLWLTASLFNAVIEEAPEILKGVEQLLVGGEALSVPAVRMALARLPATRLVNGYGPTEATTFACCYRIPADVEEGAWSIPIGRPIANTTAYVLDARGRPVPPGVPGELYIGGLGLARGYWNRPELTAERFVPDPFSQTPGSRLYRTGDMVRFREDGNLEFLGRNDDQVKIRGLRIELGEIETALRRHPAVREAAVLARRDRPGDRRIVAYVVPQTGAVPDAAELRRFLKLSLPEYMQPSVFVNMASLPLTPNGKLDRRALPPPAEGGSEVTAKADPPRDELEAKLVAIWEELLGTTPIGIHDDFFERGGHSLLALRLLARVRGFTSKPVPANLIFQAPTVAGLSEYLRGSVSGPAFACLSPVWPHGNRPPFFGIHTQERLKQRLDPAQPYYQLPYGSALLDSTEEIAAKYLKDVRMVQPVGPYYLGGFSYGGLVAFEMARQLHVQGEETAFLFLLDPSVLLPVESPPVATVPERIRNLVVHRLRSVAGLGRRAKNHRSVDGPATLPVQKTDEAPLSQREMFRRASEAYSRIVGRYVPGPYRGHVMVVSTGGMEAFGTLARCLVGTVHHQRMSCSHLDLLDEPNYSTWINMLKAGLHHAQSASRIPGEAGPTAV